MEKDLLPFYAEEWKDVDNWENCYLVSNWGRVMTLVPIKGKETRQRIVKQTVSKKTLNYSEHVVYFGRTNKGVRRQKMRVARLVAQAFVPNPENKPFVNHIDNNPLNNYYKNLEWVTQKENMAHASKQGRMKGRIR